MNNFWPRNQVKKSSYRGSLCFNSMHSRNMNVMNLIKNKIERMFTLRTLARVFGHFLLMVTLTVNRKASKKATKSIDIHQLHCLCNIGY